MLIGRGANVNAEAIGEPDGVDVGGREHHPDVVRTLIGRGRPSRSHEKGFTVSLARRGPEAPACCWPRG
jgi:hypothetical protein